MLWKNSNRVRNTANKKGQLPYSVTQGKKIVRKAACYSEQSPSSLPEASKTEPGKEMKNYL